MQVEKTIQITDAEYQEYQALKIKARPKQPRQKTVDQIENEIWLPVQDTNGLYYISNLGRLRKRYETKTGIVKDYLLSNLHRTAGCTVKLCVSPTYVINTYISHLVLKAFKPLPKGSPRMSIIHLDCNPDNNSLDNLRWATHGEAIQYKKNCGAIKPKLKNRTYISKSGKKKVKLVYFSDADINKMKSLYNEGSISQAGIALIFGCSRTYVSKIVSGKLRND